MVIKKLSYVKASMMIFFFFAKVVNGFKTLNIFAKQLFIHV